MANVKALYGLDSINWKYSKAILFQLRGTSIQKHSYINIWLFWIESIIKKKTIVTLAKKICRYYSWCKLYENFKTPYNVLWARNYQSPSKICLQKANNQKRRALCRNLEADVVHSDVGWFHWHPNTMLLIFQKMSLYTGWLDLNYFKIVVI